MHPSTQPLDVAITVEVVPGIARIDAAAWNALVPPDEPFARHEFLRALEESGSAGASSGWQPAHIVARTGSRVVAACPAWVKDNSYGEYIFDWGWARASQQAGIPYYPKVVSAVPFTPATGSRLLVAPGLQRGALERALARGLQQLADAVKAWSVHVLFCTDDEKHALGRLEGWHPRWTHQYHWVNPGLDSFEAWLDGMRSKARKEARRERAMAVASGAAVRALPGAELTPAHWAALRSFYLDTVERKWAQPYLTDGFFEAAATELAHLVVGIIAEVDGEPVAGALCFQAGQHLYGRYWGCRPGFQALHFELCYHKPIELCIERGWTRFEAGAQGEHKIKRGLLPAWTHSAHWLRHPGLGRAVAGSLQDEREELERVLPVLAQRGPFRRG